MNNQLLHFILALTGFIAFHIIFFPLIKKYLKNDFIFSLIFFLGIINFIVWFFSKNIYIDYLFYFFSFPVVFSFVFGLVFREKN
jgi:hypothetical protein